MSLKLLYYSHLAKQVPTSVSLVTPTPDRKVLPKRKVFDDISRADMCKIWTNCAFNDTSVKFGTEIGGVIRKILGYRDIADLTFSDL